MTHFDLLFIYLFIDNQTVSVGALDIFVCNTAHSVCICNVRGERYIEQDTYKVIKFYPPSTDSNEGSYCGVSPSCSSSSESNFE
jgi:hypothetical protein